MKTIKTTALTIALLMLSVTLLSSATYVFAAPTPTYSSFTLIADGTATDPSDPTVPVPVHLELAGSVLATSSKNVFSLKVEGYIASFEEFFEPVAIDNGNGVVVKPSSYAHLSIMASKSYYGGARGCWVLKGETGDLIPGPPDEVPLISLSGKRAMLPQPDGWVLLTDLELSGSIYLS